MFLKGVTHFSSCLVKKLDFLKFEIWDSWGFISDGACSTSHSGGNSVDGLPPALSEIEPVPFCSDSVCSSHASRASVGLEWASYSCELFLLLAGSPTLLLDGQDLAVVLAGSRALLLREGREADLVRSTLLHLHIPESKFYVTLI